MINRIYYVHPTSYSVTYENYCVVVHKDIAHIVILCQKAGSLWNIDSARDLVLNEIVHRELKLIPITNIQLLVSLGELSINRTLQFELYWKEGKSERVCTDFDKRLQPKQSLLDEIIHQTQLPNNFAV